MKKLFFLIVVCFLSSFLASASDCAKALGDDECVVTTELSGPLTIVPTTNGFGRSCDGFIALKEGIDAQLSSLPTEPPITVYEMGPGQGFMLTHLLGQQTAGNYGSSGLRYIYSELSDDARKSVEKVFADLSSHASNSCVSTDEPDTLVAVRGETFESSFDLFMGINTMHFLPPSKFLDGLRGANRALKNGGILAISLNYASSIKDEEFRRVFSQKSANGDYWPGYGATERETLRYVRTARFFQGDWKSAVQSSETFKTLAFFPPGIQKDVVDLIELHSRQLQGGEIIMNIHDQTSIQKLLEFCGFEILSCNIYNEIHSSKPENTYMGVIARKRYCPNYISLTPSNEWEAKEKIVAEMMSRVEVDTSDIIYWEIRNALQSILMHPTEKRLYSCVEIDAVLQRGVAYLRKTSTYA